MAAGRISFFVCRILWIGWSNGTTYYAVIQQNLTLTRMTTHIVLHTHVEGGF